MISVDIDYTDGVARCRVAGELDFYGADALRAGMAAASAYSAVVLDLSGATFIDSAGLGVIVGVIRRMRFAGSSIVLAAPRPSLERVLRMAGLDRIVVLVDTVDDAIHCLSQPAAS